MTTGFVRGAGWTPLPRLMISSAGTGTFECGTGRPKGTPGTLGLKWNGGTRNYSRNSAHSKSPRTDTFTGPVQACGTPTTSSLWPKEEEGVGSTTTGPCVFGVITMRLGNSNEDYPGDGVNAEVNQLATSFLMMMKDDQQWRQWRGQRLAQPKVVAPISLMSTLEPPRRRRRKWPAITVVAVALVAWWWVT